MKKSAIAMFPFLLVGAMMASAVSTGAPMASGDNDWDDDTISVFDDTVAVDYNFDDSAAVEDYSDEVAAGSHYVSPYAGKKFVVSDASEADFEYVVNADGMSVTLIQCDVNGATAIVIPSTVEHNYTEWRVTAVDSRAFHPYCSNASQLLEGVQHLVIQEGVTYVGQNAFGGARDLVSVSLPSSLKRISTGMFADCVNLKTFHIPDDSEMEEIEQFAFAGCTSLLSFRVPVNVSVISENAWQGCTSLMELTVSEGNAYFLSDDGVLYDGRQGVLLQYPAAKRGQQYEVRFGPVKVESTAFSGNPYIEEVKLPLTIDTISTSAFSNCASLRKVEMVGEVSSIGHHAFEQCPKLAEITLYGNPDYFTEPGMNFDAHTKVVVEPQVPFVPLPQSAKGILASVFEYVSTSSLLQAGDIVRNEDYGLPSSFGKGRWAAYGNSSPKSGVLKVLSAIPADMLALEVGSADDQILRVYIDKRDTLHPKLLFFTAGTGGNDLVVAFFENGNLQEIEKEIAKQKKKIGI